MSNQGFLRYYLIMNECVVDRFGGKYLTFKTTRSEQPHLRSNYHIYKMVSFSDFVIICDDDRAWYAKNRNENHNTAKVDPDELAWIKLSSMEIDLS